MIKDSPDFEKLKSELRGWNHYVVGDGRPTVTTSSWGDDRTTVVEGVRSTPTENPGISSDNLSINYGVRAPLLKSASVPNVAVLVWDDGMDDGRRVFDEFNVFDESRVLGVKRTLERRLSEGSAKVQNMPSFYSCQIYRLY